MTSATPLWHRDRWAQLHVVLMREIAGGEDGIPANQEQIRFWNEQGGRVGSNQAAAGRANQSTGSPCHATSHRPTGRARTGCRLGCGQTRWTCRRVGPQGAVLVWIFWALLARARERQHERDLKNLTFLQADVQTHL